MFCEKCGSQLHEGAMFCGNCGASVEAPPVVRPVSDAGIANALMIRNRRMKAAIIALCACIGVGIISVAVILAINYSDPTGSTGRGSANSSTQNADGADESADDDGRSAGEDDSFQAADGTAGDVDPDEDMAGGTTGGAGRDGDRTAGDTDRDGDMADGTGSGVGADSAGTVASTSAAAVETVSPEAYKSLEYIGDLTLDGAMPVSISPSGKYAIAVPAAASDPLIDIYEWKNEGYVLLKTVAAMGFNGRLTDAGIAWSNDGERFAFCNADTLITLQNSDIFVCDIASSEVKNLTGFSEESGNTLIGGEGRIYLDYLPVWSDDDSTIYFVRYGAADGNFIQGIYSVPSDGGEADVVRNMPDRQWNVRDALFSRGDMLYCNIMANDRTAIEGIYAFAYQQEDLLVRGARNVNDTSDEIPFYPLLMSLSADGRKMLYTNYMATMGTSFVQAPSLRNLLYSFYIADTAAPDDARELTPISSPDANVINAFFSPDERSLLQIEYNQAEEMSCFYIRDADDLTVTSAQLYADTGKGPSFGSWVLLFSNASPMRSRWLDNGYVVINGPTPVLFKVNY